MGSPAFFIGTTRSIQINPEIMSRNFRDDQLGFGGELSRKLWVRKDWISACEFHELTEMEILRKVSHRVSQYDRSVVLLDLDSTLYEVGPRNHQILKEWAESKESANYSLIRDSVLKLKYDQIGYSVMDTFSNLKINVNSEENREAVKSAYDFWFERFFTNHYLQYDRPYGGAAEFVQKLFQLSAEIVYLTGRDEPNMGKGTRANLIRDGFPWQSSKVHLLMKPNFHQLDLEHKLAAANFIHSRGTLIASFENEPPNVVALYRKFPEAMHIFVDTVCSEHPTEACKGLYRIQGFKV